MPFHLFIYGVVLPRWYQGCHWLQLNWTMQRNKKEAKTDDQKVYYLHLMSVWMSEHVCVCPGCIHCLVDWPLETSFVPHSDELWNHRRYHRGTEPVWIQARDSGALQPFDRISRKQVGVDPFCNGFLETCVWVVWKIPRIDCTCSWSTNTHMGGGKSRFTMQDKHVWIRCCLLLADAWTGKRVSESITHWSEGGSEKPADLQETTWV